MRIMHHPGQRQHESCRPQVVYGNLRVPLLEEVYRHAVERARLGPVLTQLDDTLGALCSATPRQLHPGACAYSGACSLVVALPCVNRRTSAIVWCNP